MKKKTYLFLILLLAAFLRLWQLGQYPVGLNADEAAIGYNAFSLLETGKDEHGNPWPIHFKSFGDYKPGFYFYLVLPLVKFLGLNIWAVRLPSAVLGILSVWLIYLLARELFKKEEIALISALFLTISPWHLHFSRGGWEVNAATTFILAGTYFFLKSLSTPRLYLLSLLFYLLSLYTYHSARLIVPLLVFSFTVLNFRRVFQKPKWVFVSLLVGLIALLPLLKSFLGPAGVSRFAGVGLLADTGPLWRVNEIRAQHPNPMALPLRLLFNRPWAYCLRFLENWFAHFNGGFLFIFGDVIERSRVPETGQMYYFDIFWLILGFYFLLKKKYSARPTVFAWLVIAPVAAALTFQAPHALRSHNLVIPLTLICAVGFYEFCLWLKSQKKNLALALSLFVFLLLSWNFSRYLHQYYIHYPKVYPAAWEAGFDELITYLQRSGQKYDKIYITDRYDQPYIIFLFYLQYPPEKFQEEVRLTPRDKFGFSTVRHFDKFYFQGINWDELKTEEGALIVGTDEEIPGPVTILKEIDFKNGQPAFQITEALVQ